jgi:WD40 repeat protein
VPRPERPLDAGDDVLLQFATDLRQLRAKAGNPTYRELGHRAHYSAGTLSEAAGGRRLPSLAVAMAYVRACEGDPVEWEARWHAVAAELSLPSPDSAPTSAEATPDGSSPYVGLAAFGPDDADRFFGRDRVVDAIGSRLLQQRFLAVVGASGSGKSSVLRAGLLPAVRSGPVSRGRQWSTLLITPGSHPLQKCAIGLGAALGVPPGGLVTEFSEHPRNLGLATHQVLANQADEVEFLLVVDQFEEVFTLCQDVDERALFIAALLTATQESDSRTRVVLGVRADFYAHCAQHPGLARVLQEGQVLVPPMTTNELRQVITRPAISTGHRVETALVSRLIADATGQPSVLPLVSHALLETWRHRRGNTLTLAGYEAIGGIEHAIARTSELVYTTLNPDQQRLARQIFLRLTAIGEGTEDTKRRIRRSELDTDNPDTALVLDGLVTARLIVMDADSIEIAHESLIRCWPRLHDWLTQDREGLRIHRQLTDAAGMWESLDCDLGALYRGTRLTLAQDWATHNDAALIPLEREFLNASAAAQHRERVRDRRRTRRLRHLVALFAVLFLVTVATTALAVWAQQRATEQRDIALSHKVATDAGALRALDPTLSAQLSLAAYRLSPTAAARSSLLSTFATPYATRLTGHTGIVESAVFSPDGHTAATTGDDHTVRLWDVTNPHQPSELATLTGHTDIVRSGVFSPNGHILATASRDRTIRLWDVTNSHHPISIATLTSRTNNVWSVAFSPDGHLLAIASDDRTTVRLWDITNIHQPSELAALTGHTDVVLSVRFSPDGQLVATAGDDHTARLWDITDPHNPVSLPPLTGYAGTVWSAVFSPDGQMLATAGVDKTARLWNVTDPHHPVALAPLIGHTDTIRSVAFSPDGHTLATTSHDHTARLWDITDPHHPVSLGTLTGHTDNVVSVMFSPDGHTLATASDDGTARLWDIPGPILTGHNDSVYGVAFSPDGHTAATSSIDHTVRLWDLTVPQHPSSLAILTGHTDTVRSVTFSPNGHTLATTSDDHTARLWNVAEPSHPREMATLTGHTDLVWRAAFSPDGHILATAGEDATARLWDVTDLGHPTVMAVLIGHSNNVESVAFSPDGHTLATTSNDRTARLWDVTNPYRPNNLVILTGHSQAVRSAVFSPDGHTLATASLDHTARLWDITDLRHPIELATLTGHTNAVYGVAFSPAGHTLATASGDNTARLWEITDPRHPSEVATLTGHTDRIYAVTFSPDGHFLATSSADHTARLWETDVERVAARICVTAHPTITRSEWDQYFPSLAYHPSC